MKIFVIGRNGLGLMPTTPLKARTLSELKVISHNHNWLTGALVPIGK